MPDTARLTWEVTLCVAITAVRDLVSLATAKDVVVKAGMSMVRGRSVITADWLVAVVLATLLAIPASLAKVTSVELVTAAELASSGISNLTSAIVTKVYSVTFACKLRVILSLTGAVVTVATLLEANRFKSPEVFTTVVVVLLAMLLMKLITRFNLGWLVLVTAVIEAVRLIVLSTGSSKGVAVDVTMSATRGTVLARVAAEVAV